MSASWSHDCHDLHGQSRLTDRDEGRYTLSHTRPMSCHITSLPWQEREEELNKLLLTKVSDRDRNVKVNIKLLGRIALVAQRPIVIKLSRERSVGRSVGRSSGGFNGRPHMQWPTRPQHIGPLEAPQSCSLVACNPITVAKQIDLARVYAITWPQWCHHVVSWYLTLISYRQIYWRET